MNTFNPNLCYSIKSKHCLNEQCTNKPKLNETLCGKHLNCKNLMLFTDYNINIDTNIDIETNTDMETNNNINNNVDDKIYDEINNMLIKEMDTEKKDKENEDNDKIIYTKEELYDIVQKNKNINVFSYRKSIRECCLNKFINTKQTKQCLIMAIKQFMERERYFMANQYAIIQIQRLYRGWQARKRKNCFNDTDILTFDSIYDIPDKYFYVFHDNISNRDYGYDIRTLIQIILSEYPSCPYTFRSFTDEEKTQIQLYKNYLEKKGVKLEIENAKMTPEEEIDMKIKDVFYQINMLDNYTDPDWFKSLSLKELIQLYIKMEDIWNYRTAMPIEARCNIIHNGIAFNTPLYIIKSQKSLINMQHIILNEFTRFITEGINRDERKLGAIIILSGLVEVSFEASIALPHLVQI